jgi:hypothetical protein
VASTDAGGPLWPLVKALQLLPCLGSVNQRVFVVRLVIDRLGSLRADEHPQIQQHIFNIVEACARRPDGLQALYDVVSELDKGVIHLREVEALISQRTLPPVWPDDERKQLFALLSGIIFTDLVDLYHQVAGLAAPELPAQTTYREVFLTLETLNTDANGLPKPIVFVEHLAKRLRHELAIELRRWADRQANRLGVITELQAMRREFRAPPPGPEPNAPAYLVLLLRYVGLSQDRFQLCHWSQLDPSAEGWHPERGEDFTGTLGEVQHKVAALIESVETKWARYQPDIRIEVVLSGELLNLDIDQWPWEVDTPLPVPIGCRYAFATRSLERMQTGKWHRSWHTRWGILTGQLKTGAVMPTSTVKSDGHKSLRSLIADFENDANLVTLMLSAPPDPAATGGDEIAIALRAGVPVIIWHRRDCGSEDFLATAEELLHGDASASILQRMRHVRTTAFESHSGHVGHHLALLWDDPERLVVPSELGPPKEATV